MGELTSKPFGRNSGNIFDLVILIASSAGSLFRRKIHPDRANAPADWCFRLEFHRKRAAARRVQASVFICKHCVTQICTKFQLRRKGRAGALKVGIVIFSTLSPLCERNVSRSGRKSRGSAAPAPVLRRNACRACRSRRRALHSSGSFLVTIPHRPHFGIFAVESDQASILRFGIGADCVGGAFGFANAAAVDAFIRVDGPACFRPRRSNPPGKPRRNRCICRQCSCRSQRRSWARSYLSVA